METQRYQHHSPLPAAYKHFHQEILSVFLILETRYPSNVYPASYRESKIDEAQHEKHLNLIKIILIAFVEVIPVSSRIFNIFISPEWVACTALLVQPLQRLLLVFGVPSILQ